MIDYTRLSNFSQQILEFLVQFINLFGFLGSDEHHTVHCQSVVQHVSFQVHVSAFLLYFCPLVEYFLVFLYYVNIQHSPDSLYLYSTPQSKCIRLLGPKKSPNSLVKAMIRFPKPSHSLKALFSQFL